MKIEGFAGCASSLEGRPVSFQFHPTLVCILVLQIGVVVVLYEIFKTFDLLVVVWLSEYGAVLIDEVFKAATNTPTALNGWKVKIADDVELQLSWYAK